MNVTSKINYILPIISMIEAGAPNVEGKTGPLNITALIVDTVNDYFFSSYSLQDMEKEVHAKHVCLLYLVVQSILYTKENGVHPSIEDLIRIWHSGFSGYQSEEAKRYLEHFEKVNEEVNELLSSLN